MPSVNVRWGRGNRKRSEDGRAGKCRLTPKSCAMEREISRFHALVVILTFTLVALLIGSGSWRGAGGALLGTQHGAAPETSEAQAAAVSRGGGAPRRGAPLLPAPG